MLMEEGSPPPVRGIHHRKWHWRISPGITPASAGHTNVAVSKWHGIQDHPRQCGAYSLIVPKLRFCRWITPASAGHT